MGKERSKPFRVACGLRQGCILSPLLFSLYINSLVSKLKEAEVGVMCRGQLISALLYTDDAVIFAEDEDAVMPIRIEYIQCGQLHEHNYAYAHSLYTCNSQMQST